jgi:hypothetical protein
VSKFEKGDAVFVLRPLPSAEEYRNKQGTIAFVGNVGPGSPAWEYWVEFEEEDWWVFSEDELAKGLADWGVRESLEKPASPFPKGYGNGWFGATI